MSVEPRKYANADELLDNLTYDNLDLDRPVLVGACTCIVSSVMPEMETRSGVPQMIVSLTTQDVCKDMKGNDVQPGWKVTTRFNLTVHPNVAPDKAEQAAKLNRNEQATFMCAALGVKYDPQNGPKWKPTEQYVGRTLVARFAAREDKNKTGTFYQDVKGFNASSIPAPY